MSPLLVPIAMAAVLAVAWALPLAWWSVGSTAGMLTVLIALAAWPTRTAGWWSLSRQPTTHAACCLWGIGAIGISYAVRALTSSVAGDHFTRLGYPFLVGTGLALPGGELLLVLVVLVSLTPVVLWPNSGEPRATPENC